MGRRSVQVGDRVHAGQVVALPGATGKVTGPHLHLEAFDGDQRIVSREELLRQGDRTLADALQRQPGITISNTAEVWEQNWWGQV